MNKIFTVLIIFLTSLSIAPFANASLVAQNLCKYVSEDDNVRLRSYLRMNGLKLRNVFDGIQCNGNNLLNHADQNQSLATGTIIIKRLPKHKVVSILDSLQSNDFVTIAQQRIAR